MWIHKIHNFDFYHHESTALLSLSFLLLSLFLIVFSHCCCYFSCCRSCFCFCSCLLCSLFAILRYEPTDSFLTNLLFCSLHDHPQQEFLLMQVEHLVNHQTLSAFKAMSWTASLPFKGLFCLETDIFNASLETNKYDLFEYTTSMYRGSKLIWFSMLLYPITGEFGKDSGGHSLITDLLQTAKSVGNCALVSNGSYGLGLPTNVTDTDVQSEQRILKCSCFRKYSFEQGGMSSTLNQGTGTDFYRVTTYTGDKKNARGCKSSGLA
jgi:hypothetical protein